VPPPWLVSPRTYLGHRGCQHWHQEPPSGQTAWPELSLAQWLEQPLERLLEKQLAQLLTLMRVLVLPPRCGWGAALHASQGR